MSTKKIFFLILIATSVFLVGCTHFQKTLIADEQTYPATNPENIKVFLSSETPKNTYKEIGFIVASKDNSKEAVNFLKDEAAKMGADALLNCEVRVHTSVMLFIFIPIPINTITASGVAVKYTN
jgi:hypothetical protein